MQGHQSETFTVTETARLLGISRQLAYILASQGRLPGALRLGHRWVVSRRQLEKFIEGGGGAENI